MEGLGCFFSELDCSWDSGCVRLCSSLGSPSVAHAHPLHKVYFFKDFLLVKGRNPVWHIFLAPSLSWFSVRAFVKSLCGVPCGGSVQHPGWELQTHTKTGASVPACNHHCRMYVPVLHGWFSLQYWDTTLSYGLLRYPSAFHVPGLPICCPSHRLVHFFLAFSLPRTCTVTIQRLPPQQATGVCFHPGPMNLPQKTKFS